MSQLDDLFAEALIHEATTPTPEQLTAAEEEAVAGALHRRRTRFAVQAGVAIGLLVAAVGIGAAVTQGDDAAPVLTPTAPPVVGDLTADPRMPQAPLINEAQWDTVDESWDAEFASFVHGAESPSGSAVALYLTPPRGERELAFANADFPLEKPVLLAWYASDRQAVFIDEETHRVWYLTVQTGIVWPAAIYPDDRDSGWPLGKSSSGTSYFVLNGKDENGTLRPSIQYLNEWGFALSLTGDLEWADVELTAVSPVWGDTIIVGTEDGLAPLAVADDMVYKSPGPALPNTKGCEFAVWTFSGTFVATCDDGAEVVEIDPTTGAQRSAGPSQPAYVAISSTRGGTGVGDTGYAMTIPPLVFSASSIIDQATTLVDLRDGFTDVPTTYAVIFGARPQGN